MSFDGYEEDSLQRRKDTVVGISFFGVLALATLIDLIIDTQEGTPLSHMATEAIVILLSLGAAFFLWRRMNRRWGSRTAQLRSQIELARADATRWREEAGSLARGLSEAIDRQLESWGLSPAEKEVTFLLIKGLSLKEIATLRSTTERTVRQQATTIYRKANLEGRAQLAAFFLEDLLVRPTEAMRF